MGPKVPRSTLLAPDPVQAIREGEEPDGVTPDKLYRVPVEWEEQRRAVVRGAVGRRPVALLLPWMTVRQHMRRDSPPPLATESQVSMLTGRASHALVGELDKAVEAETKRLIPPPAQPARLPGSSPQGFAAASRLCSPGRVPSSWERAVATDGALRSPDTDRVQ